MAGPHTILIRFTAAILACLLFVLFSYRPGITQPVGRAPDPGEVTKRLTSRSDSSQSYAVYLPETYQSDKEWPVLFVMDPRGRSLRGLELFRAAAEEFGYIVISSYNTRSDGPEQPNVDALNAMINDSYQLFSVDTKRLYLAGFSGTARLAWPYGYQLKQHVAGVIGFGAASSPDFVIEGAVRLNGKAFSYYGGSGLRDFNYMELLMYEQRLEAINYPYHMRFFGGGHRWAPEVICRDALRWMEIRAMNEGRRPVDSSFVNRYRKEKMGRADSLAEAGAWYDSYRLLASLQRNLKELTDITEVTRTLRKIERSREFKREQQSKSQEVDRFLTYYKVIQNYFEQIGQGGLPTTRRMAADLEIERLQRESSDSTKTYHARASQVLLEYIYVKTSFYEPREYLRKHQPEKAKTMLDLADIIKPKHPRNCLQYARIYAQLNKADLSFRALSCLKNAGWLTREMLSSDPYFEPIRSDSRYQDLLSELPETENL